MNHGQQPLQRFGQASRQKIGVNAYLRENTRLRLSGNPLKRPLGTPFLYTSLVRSQFRALVPSQPGQFQKPTATLARRVCPLELAADRTGGTTEAFRNGARCTGRLA